MIDKHEMLFVVDEDNQPLEPQLRSLAHKDKLWHRTCGIWVINHKNQILCQKRSMKKDLKPGYWEPFLGGHLAPKGDYLLTAVAEIGEELGITIKENDLIPYKILKSDKPDHKEFQHIFALILERNDLEFDYEKNEIDELKWVYRQEIRNLLVDKKDPFWVHKEWDEEVLTWLTTLT